MKPDLAAIFNEPRLMLLGFDGDFVEFVPMTRESYHQSIFLDDRVQAAPGPILPLPLDPLLAHLEATRLAPPRLRFIHHFAQSGSTLLARALDQPENLV